MLASRDFDAFPVDDLFRLLADTVLGLHLVLVAFVVGGLVAVPVGHAVGWRWVDAFWFRVVHLAIIGIVVAESWFDVTCPLTAWERGLRVHAHEVVSGRDFISDWMQRLLYIDAPPSVFVAAYTAFGLAVAATWWRWPPVMPWRRKTGRIASG